METKQRLNTAKISKTAQLNPNGFTIAWTGNKPKLSGYVVAVSDLKTKPHNIKQALQKLFKVAKTLNAQSYIGGWKDAKTGYFYLDISLNVPSIAEAETIGKVFNQKAVFNIAKLEAVYI